MLKPVCVVALAVLASGSTRTAAEEPKGKSRDKVEWLVKEDFTNVDKTLPKGWKQVKGSQPLVVTSGVMHPVPAVARVPHSVDIPAALEGDFVIEFVFSSFHNPPIARGKPQPHNLGLLLVDKDGKITSKDGTLRIWQQGQGTRFGGFVSVLAAGEKTTADTAPVQRSGEGEHHTVELERKDKEYFVSVNGKVLYKGTLDDLGDRPFGAVRFGLLGGDNGQKGNNVVFTQVHSVKIGVKK
ncbi:MAG: hypothetical protein J0I06_25010 [Planctomycetes bacterium]|nr:hypothetical protein [Planctomycetota bacterium]